MVVRTVVDLVARATKVVPVSAANGMVVVSTAIMVLAAGRIIGRASAVVVVNSAALAARGSPVSAAAVVSVLVPDLVAVSVAVPDSVVVSAALANMVASAKAYGTKSFGGQFGGLRRASCNMATTSRIRRPEECFPRSW